MGNNCACLQNRDEDNRYIEKEPKELFRSDTNKEEHEEEDIFKMNGGLKQSISEKDNNNDNSDNTVSKAISKNGIKIKPINNKDFFAQVNDDLIPSSPMNLVKSQAKRNTSTKKTNSEIRKSPLEVINELNGEISKGSYDPKDLSSNMQKKALSKKSTLREIEEAKNSQIRNNDCSTHNDQLKDIYNNNKNDHNVSIEEKKPKNKAIHRSAQKKPMKEIHINDIIPVSRLQYLNENDLLIQGEFFKSTKDKDSKRFILTSNFLYLTKSELRIYRSKEAVIYQQSPLQKIHLCNIVSCELIPSPLHNTNPNQKYTFMMEYLQNTNGMRPDIIERLQSNSQFDISLSKIQFDSSMMKNKQIFKNSFKNNNNNTKEHQSNNVIDANERKKGKKMSLLGSEKEEKRSVKKNDDLLFENNVSNRIYFSVENGDNVMKWVCAINYLISR